MEGNTIFLNENELTEKQRKIKRKQYKRKNKSEKSHNTYLSANPQPSYSNFHKPDYIDTTGREYKYASENHVFNPDTTLDAREWPGEYKFWIRLPIWQRKSIGFPEAEGEQITFYHPKLQVTATGITDGVFHSPKGATGYVILKNFKTLGPLVDPKEYEYLVDKQMKTIFIEKTLF